MRVLVCGDRYYADRTKVFAELDRLAIGDWALTHVIEGGATGADALAAEWAKENLPKENHLPFPAKWRDMSEPCVRKVRRNGTEYNALAGSKRNTQMLAEGKPDYVIAFPGNRGTADMIKQAEKAGVPVIKIP